MSKENEMTMSQSNVSGRRVVVTPEERAQRENRRRAALWSAVWECSQTMSFDEIREHVEATLREIESDAE